MGKNTTRDDFSLTVKNMLCQRVAGKCSNPKCRCETIGPHTNPNKRQSTGQAAHITGASARGPRYNPDLSVEQRSDISNGIWLCNNCAKMIDNDPVKYPAELLHAWKANAEYEQFCKVNGRRNDYVAMLEQELKGRKLEACRQIKVALDRLHHRLYYAFEYWKSNFSNCDYLESELIDHYLLYKEELEIIYEYQRERDELEQLIREFSLDIGSGLCAMLQQYCGLTYFHYLSDNCGLYDNYWPRFFEMLSEKYEELSLLKTRIDIQIERMYDVNEFREPYP